MTDQRKGQKKQGYRNSDDRIVVERAFALAKCSYGLGHVVTKLDEIAQALSISADCVRLNFHP